MVLWEGRNGPATQSDCRQVRDTYNLDHMKVVYQPAGRELRDADLDDRHYHFVLIEGARVFHKRQFNDSTFEDALQRALMR